MRNIQIIQEVFPIVLYDLVYPLNFFKIPTVFLPSRQSIPEDRSSSIPEEKYHTWTDVIYPLKKFSFPLIFFCRTFVSAGKASLFQHDKQTVLFRCFSDIFKGILHTYVHDLFLSDLRKKTPRVPLHYGMLLGIMACFSIK